MGVESLLLPGFEVNLQKVTVRIIQEMRLHGRLLDEVVFNLKIDGRPFFGMHNYHQQYFVLEQRLAYRVFYHTCHVALCY